MCGSLSSKSIFHSEYINCNVSKSLGRALLCVVLPPTGYSVRRTMEKLKETAGRLKGYKGEGVECHECGLPAAQYEPSPAAVRNLSSREGHNRG